MRTPPPLKVDASNVGDHYYLRLQDECYYFHEYTAGQGYAHSPGNGLISNLKKSVERRGRPEYHYKEQAIRSAGEMLGAALRTAPELLTQATLVPVPPSRAHGDPGFDDRVMQIVALAGQGTSAEVRELLIQQGSYSASHTQGAGQRKKPAELRALYRLDGAPPRRIVILVDDVLTSGAHFVACRDAILASYPGSRIIGFFIARRAMPDPSDVFDVL